MAKLHSVALGGERFSARSGQNLLDAALTGGVELPHDCRAGRCGACLTKVLSGVTLGGESHQSGMVHACQAMVFSDLELAVEPVPPVQRAKGRVTAIAELADDIVEVAIETPIAASVLPGQYCRFQFRGFPARPFSPTAALDGHWSGNEIRLHVKQVRGGRVTPQLGRSIVPGHSVVIDGPFGHAYLRHGAAGRLVLIGSGTGFAPVWAVAASALHENPLREMVLIAASRKADAFFMGPALELAALCPGVSVAACIEELDAPSGCVVPGRPADHVPELKSDDIVYAAGAPALMDAVGAAARQAGCTFYSDSFETNPVGETGWSRWKGWLDAGKQQLLGVQ